jgi:hypothetical protein
VHQKEWAKDWESKNPLAGQATFASMTPVQRVRTVSWPALCGTFAVRRLRHLSGAGPFANMVPH